MLTILSLFANHFRRNKFFLVEPLPGKSTTIKCYRFPLSMSNYRRL
jgi:hypothetical protein